MAPTAPSRRAVWWTHGGDAAHLTVRDHPHVGDVLLAACGRRIEVSRGWRPLRPCRACAAARDTGRVAVPR